MPEGLQNLLPERVVRVSESGIHTPEDLVKAASVGADGVLIGESLMRAERPGDALAELLDGFRELQEADA